MESLNHSKEDFELDFMEPDNQNLIATIRRNANLEAYRVFERDSTVTNEILNATFENFKAETPKEKAAKDFAIKQAKQYLDGMRGNTIITGPPGVGKSHLAYVLGRSNLNSYGYLNFSNWCNKEEYCKHYLRYSENKFKKNLLIELRKSSNSEIDEKLKIDQSKYPPIWLAVNVLTFGQMVNMLELMSVKKLGQISSFFDCENSELISWLKCINLVRNICAHNSNIIDFKFKTVPQLKDEWKDYLYELKPGVYSNRIALPFLIISYMMDKINPKYHFQDIVNSLDKLIRDDNNAKYYGFKSISTMKSIKSKWIRKPVPRRRTR